MNRFRRSEIANRETANPDSADSRAGHSAAQWFVRLDAGLADDSELAEFEAWLMSDPAHADAFARCAQAVQLAGSVSDTTIAPRPLLEVTPVTRVYQAMLRPLARPAVAWSITLAAVLVAVAGWWRTPDLTVSADVSPTPAGLVTPVEQEQPREFRQRVATDYAIQPVMLSPGQVIVDALSIGVRPFQPSRPDEADDRRAAADLYASLMQRLSATSGVYALGVEYTAPFMNVDAFAAPMEIVDIAAQLGVRSIVDARVQASDGVLQLDIQLTDASGAATSLSMQFSGPSTEVDDFFNSFVDQMFTVLQQPQFASAARQGY
jgi:hypothetical protein